ncbi:U1 small nuclear ribonucleoprotein 70 kDa [Mactra antiquata]
MTAFLPPNLLALFAARDPIPYLPPADKLGHEKRRNSFGGVALLLQEFEDPKDTPPPTRVETKDERKERKRKERAEQIAYKLEQDLALWDPHSQNTSTDPYKTLFVARINYDTSESKMRREFEVYGPIRKIKLIGDKSSGKPRGYAFIEYEHERDMHSAYKHADGKKIDGRRVLVDVERGRTVKGWRPRRLGGGLGGTRKGGPDENTRFSGRDDYGGRNENFRGGAEREREREPERERERERPERRRRSRSKERERDRDRRRRSRSRDRKRDKEGGEDEDKGDRKKRSRRSRSRDRDRDHDRSKKRSRSKDRERKRRRSRSRDRKTRAEDENEQPPVDYGGEPGEYMEPQIKEEPYDDGSYGGFQNGNQGEQEEGQYEEYPKEEVEGN